MQIAKEKINMGFTVDPTNLSCYNGYVPPSLKDAVVYVTCFDKEQAANLCTLMDKGTKVDNGVHDPLQGAKVDSYHRSSVGVMLDKPTYDWAYNRIEHVAGYWLKLHTTLPIKSSRIAEPIQFLCYTAEKQGRFRRHWDDAYHDKDGVFHFVSPHRKFTCIVGLNNDYEGGDLILDTVKYPNGESLHLHLDPGAMLLFPSDQRFPHEVTPVTKGVRRSIVAWLDIVV